MLHEEPLAQSPIDEQVLGEEHRGDHAEAVVHPAERPELAHGGIHDGEAGLSLAPGGESAGVIVPDQAIGLGLECPAHADPWEADQDVLVELTPGHLADPVHRAGITRIPTLRVGIERGMDALPGRDRSDGEIWGQPTRGIQRWRVALGLVPGDHAGGKAFQPLERVRLASRPE